MRPLRYKNVILNRLRIGDTRMTHSHIINLSILHCHENDFEIQHIFLRSSFYVLSSVFQALAVFFPFNTYTLLNFFLHSIFWLFYMFGYSYTFCFIQITPRRGVKQLIGNEWINENWTWRIFCTKMRKRTKDIAVNNDDPRIWSNFSPSIFFLQLDKRSHE